MYVQYTYQNNKYISRLTGWNYIHAMYIYNICTVTHAMIKRKELQTTKNTYKLFKKKANNGYHRLKIHELHNLSELSSHSIYIYICDILTGFILPHVYFQRSSKVP